jgi:hypothetical protein
MEAARGWLRVNRRKSSFGRIDTPTGKIGWEIPQIDTDRMWGGSILAQPAALLSNAAIAARSPIDAPNGKPLWNFHPNQPWHASSITYMVDGKQHVAVAAGSNIVAYALPERHTRYQPLIGSHLSWASISESACQFAGGRFRSC